MRLIIFAGHHKVGSTSLQDFLSRNAIRLIRSGILYPAVDFEGMSLMMARALDRGEVPENLPINAREPHNALAFRMLADNRNGTVPEYHEGLPSRGQMFRALRKQVEFLRPDTVILAAEVFANFAPADPRMIKMLAELFPEAEITVLFTLRRIDEYIASWQGQRLKFGHKIEALRSGGLKHYYGNIHFNYRQMVEGWYETLPQAEIILRDYADVRAAGGSIPDFLTQTRLSVPDNLEAEKRTNESLHRGLYEIARLGNHGLPGPKARNLRGALRRITDDLNLPPSGDIELFGREIRGNLIDRFEPINQWLGEKVGQPEGFFPDLDAARTCHPVQEKQFLGSAIDSVLANRRKIRDPELVGFIKSIATAPVS